MSDDTVVKIIYDEENSTDLSKTVNIINKIDLINVDLNTLIKKRSYIFCEKCNFQPNCKKRLKVHKLWMHARYSVITGKIVGQYTYNWRSPHFTRRVCRVCWFYTDKKEINSHITSKHEDLVKDKIIISSDVLFLKDKPVKSSLILAWFVIVGGRGPLISMILLLVQSRCLTVK